MTNFIFPVNCKLKLHFQPLRVKINQKRNKHEKITVLFSVIGVLFFLAGVSLAGERIVRLKVPGCSA